MDSEAFVKWLRHVKNFVDAFNDRKVLLISNNHSNHMSAGAADFADTGGIIMFTIPLHTFHYLQSVHRTCVGPRKPPQSCSWSMDDQIKNPSRRLTDDQDAGLFATACLRLSPLQSGIGATRVESGISNQIYFFVQICRCIICVNKFFQPIS